MVLSSDRPILSCRAVVIVAVLMAAWCLTFAAVNVSFEVTGHFAEGKYADDAHLISVVDWLAAVLKVVGGAVALLAVARRPPLPPRIVGVLVWGAFATLGIYVLGSIVEGVAMLAGLMDGADRIGPAALAYVAWFACAATGFGVLAVWHMRRHHLGRGTALTGLLIGPAVLALLLAVVPSVLGLLP